MPLYEYQCDACGHRFETIHQKFSDPPQTECPKCGGVVRKLQSAPAIQFKGSGWYITDYARKDSAASSDGSTGEGKADAKKASKDDGKTSETKAADDKADKKTEKKSDAAPAPSDTKTS